MDIKKISWFDSNFYQIVYIPHGETEAVTVHAPSVTNILQIAPKDFIAHWRGEIGNREADLQIFESQQRGIRTHHGWHILSKGGKVVYSPYQNPQYTREQLVELEKNSPNGFAVIGQQDEWWALCKLVDFMNVTKAQIVETERTVFSETRLEAGTLDNVFYLEKGTYEVNGSSRLVITRPGLYLADLKTGKEIYREAYLQLSAYERFYFEMTGAKIEGCLILHTSSRNKKGIEGFGVTLINDFELAGYFAEYDLLSKLWHTHNAKLLPIVRELPTELMLRGNET